MKKLRKKSQEQYNEVVKNMSEKDKKNYDSLLKIRAKYNYLVMELHGMIFPEESDFTLDDNVDAERRRKGENPMCKDYIKRMDEKRAKLGFLPLTKNGYAQDTEATIEYCKKLITGEIKYENFN